jgi:plastocyanin
MRTLRSASALLAVILVAACTSTAPGWTYAPVPSAAPVASGQASAGPAGSAAASAAPSAPASSGTAGTVIKLAAQNIAFDQTSLTAPAGQPFQVEFTNNDASVPHDVEIKDSSGAVQFHGETFPGVATKTYDVPALPAGQYTFACTVHSNMTGTLTAG